MKLNIKWLVYFFLLNMIGGIMFSVENDKS